MKRKWSVFVGTAVLSICTVALFFLLNGFYVSVELSGDMKHTLEYGQDYEEPGGKVYLFGKYLFREGVLLEKAPITVTGNVLEDRLGIFPLTYRTEYLIWQAESVRDVCVVDTKCPQIYINEATENPDITGEKQNGPEVEARDNFDGDLTDSVKCMEEDGFLIYSVTDSSGNPAYARWEIPETEPDYPVITIEGEPECSITVGSVFCEPGYSAADPVDGDLTEAVTVESTVDNMTPGQYTVTYHVVNSRDQESEVSRLVRVEAKSWPDTQWPDDKTIYLTFDDGPGPYTQELLDVLERYNVRATFFVVDSDYRHLMKDIVAGGHSIGIHSTTHDYTSVYSDPAAFFADLTGMQQIIYEQTGVWTTLMRFPGGGSNLVSKRSCPGIMSVLTTAVRNAGYQYFDWNVDSEDASTAHKTAQVRDNVIKGIRESGIAMVLQHDVHSYSVKAVEEIIQWGLENGYRFLAVRDTTPGFHHDVLN